MTASTLLGRARGTVLLAAFALAALPAAALAQVQPVPAPGEDRSDPVPDITGPVPKAEKPPDVRKSPEAEKGNAPADSPEQRDALLGELYARLATAADEASAAQIATAVEQLWQHSGSPTADLLLARATAATEAQRAGLAMRLLDAAIELQPDYAEAWNRRAYLFYLQDDHKRALGDIRRVLALEPNHYKALEGLANILQGLGEKKAALEAYDSLLKIHPMAPGARKSRDDLEKEIEGQGI